MELIDVNLGSPVDKNDRPSEDKPLAPRLNRLRKNSVFCAVLKGHDFSRAANASKSMWASAPEGLFSSLFS
jgi:hypothetical protein